MQASETRRVRALGAIESYLASTHEAQLGATQLVCLAELEGTTDVPAARSALLSLQRRHPMLRMSLERADDRWWYVPASHPDLPLRVCEAEPGEWEDYVRAESDQPAPWSAPAWRATLLLAASGDRSALLITAHHATSDGVSLLGLSRQFVDAHNRALAGAPSAEPPFPIREPVERLLATDGTAMPGDAPAAEGFRTAEPFVPGWPVEQGASFADRRTRTHWLTFEPGETGSLVAHCRTEGTTVNAVIIAALDAAAQQLPFRKPALPCLVPVSVRGSTSPSVSELEYGTFIGEFSMSLQAADRELDRWERARRIVARQKRLAGGALALPTEFEQWPSNEQPGLATFRRGCLVTNLGRSAPPTEVGALRLGSFRFLVCPRGGTYVISLSAATVAGRMIIGLSSVAPLLGDSSAATFQAAFGAEMAAALADAAGHRVPSGKGA